jgi:hypothetical protein
VIDPKRLTNALDFSSGTDGAEDKCDAARCELCEDRGKAIVFHDRTGRRGVDVGEHDHGRKRLRHLSSDSNRGGEPALSGQHGISGDATMEIVRARMPSEFPDVRWTRGIDDQNGDVRRVRADWRDLAVGRVFLHRSNG